MKTKELLIYFWYKDDNISQCDEPPIANGKQNMCRAYFPVFYYDKINKKCAEYIYGGCHATKNLFGTLEDCEKRCMNKPANQNKETIGKWFMAMVIMIFNWWWWP